MCSQSTHSFCCPLVSRQCCNHEGIHRVVPVHGYPEIAIQTTLLAEKQVVDNETANRDDRLFRVRYVLDTLNNKFGTVYVPYGNYTVDESMVKFKGGLGFRQSMPAKPIKWGVKIWSLAESTTGYMSKFQVYTGREDGTGERSEP